ncbi:TPM domain-containing protein [Methylovirgula sp. 4M-Z18]|uniref:TPM domain-containing protein n=1 Tax=Methylovirgula sp. 4M-Z18 TaxID=2293567 RepID=UPI000E2F43C1|nr:TPM domain-containing protein [Methylovirgula sp. 4M-Z18]RFB78432.1 hypothetical protein DYH55_16980 [Methylovirgula sp. 4M-Z18]
MPIARADYEAVAAAIKATEAHTSAQLVCVLARSSSYYGYIPLTWAALIALCVPLPLILLTHWPVQHIYAAQLLTFLALGIVLSLAPVRMRLVPRNIQRSRAHRAAIEQFAIRGLRHTSERTGVLIFMSVAERYVRIIADDGVAAKIPNHAWQAVVERLVIHARDGHYAQGFVDALKQSGDLLAEPFPPRRDAKNELPDRLYVI